MFPELPYPIIIDEVAGRKCRLFFYLSKKIYRMQKNKSILLYKKRVCSEQF
ncbi:hypothetical protein MMC2321_05091 [Chitinophaga sp. MM2321]